MKVSKIAGPYELERLTLDGWELVQTIANAQRVNVQRELVQDGYRKHEPNPNGYPTETWVPQQWQSSVDVVNEPLFLLVKDVDVLTREARLEAEIVGFTKECADKADKMNELLAFAEKQKELHADARKEIEMLKSACGTKDACIKQMAVQLRELERDLARVRTEIGDSRWREITSCDDRESAD